mmetsp:Transcript_10767/g.25726  ORF Transcript_10767/g.25726 Transcript_10767/m.25726 type:complete len:187 (+) Transcript_10767:42-602(+)
MTGSVLNVGDGASAEPVVHRRATVAGRRHTAPLVPMAERPALPHRRASEELQQRPHSVGGASSRRGSWSRSRSGSGVSLQPRVRPNTAGWLTTTPDWDSNPFDFSLYNADKANRFSKLNTFGTPPPLRAAVKNSPVKPKQFAQRSAGVDFQPSKGWYFDYRDPSRYNEDPANRFRKWETFSTEPSR